MRRAAVAGAAVWLAAALATGCTGRSDAATGRTVTIEVHYSHFSVPELRVPHGVPVTFVIDNSDPIDHEFLVGDEAMQKRHERGTERRHGARPTEISLPPNAVSRTTITFDRPGVQIYACHLPGHFAYGMRGTVVVT